METRICQNCGKEFEVDSRKEFSTNKRRVLCDDCIENMSEQEKMRLYQKRSVENTGEERTCLNCGKTFYVKHKEGKTSSRVK